MYKRQFQDGRAEESTPEPGAAVAGTTETSATAAAGPLQPAQEGDDEHQGDMQQEGPSEVAAATFAEDDETRQELEDANNAAEELLRVCRCILLWIWTAACAFCFISPSSECCITD